MKNFIIIMLLLQTMLIYSVGVMSLPEIGLYRVDSCLTSKSTDNNIKKIVGDNFIPHLYIRIGKDTVEAFIVYEHYSKKYMLEGSYTNDKYNIYDNYFDFGHGMIYMRNNKYYYDNDVMKLLIIKSDDDLTNLISVDNGKFNEIIKSSKVNKMYGVGN